MQPLQQFLQLTRMQKNAHISSLVQVVNIQFVSTSELISFQTYLISITFFYQLPLVELQNISTTKAWMW